MSADRELLTFSDEAIDRAFAFLRATEVDADDE